MRLIQSLAVVFSGVLALSGVSYHALTTGAKLEDSHRTGVRVTASRPAFRTGLPTKTPITLDQLHWVRDFDQQLGQFKSVFWEPADTESLRELIRETSLVKGQHVLEIGTGTGLIALCCLHAGASRVVATDVNPTAIANARYNAEHLGLDQQRLDTRLVSAADTSAYSVVRPGERFDLIISNPPWEDAVVKGIDAAAFYDPDFNLLDSLLAGLREHLTPDGKALLAYGNVTAIRRVQDVARSHGLVTRIVDERPLDTLPELFLPGMLVEVTVDRVR